MKKVFKKLLSITIMLTLSIIPASCSYQETFLENNSGNSTENSNEKSTQPNTGSKLLLPASSNTLDGQKWGYINERAEFKIKPEYDGVEEFNKAGIALAFNYYDKDENYSNNKNIFIIDKSGKQLCGPIRCSKYITAEKNIIIVENGKSKFINKAGVVFKEIENEIMNYSEGMLGFRENFSYNSKYGYMDEDGTIIIPANYNYAEQFKGSKAKVTIKDGDKTEQILIDNKGNKYVNPDALIPFQDKATKKYGYKDMNGMTIIEPQYNSANEFENGVAIVELPNNKEMKRRMGLIDKNGSFIIKPEYTGIHSIGEGLYSVNQGAFLYHDYNVPNAIFNVQGEKLSDFLYFNIQEFKGEYTSACDEKTTFFIDKKGAIVSTMPKINGIGTIKKADGIISGSADGIKSYYKENGELIWMQDNSILLSDGIKVERAIYRPNYSTYIEYPELKNLPDQIVQDKINKKLKSEFVGTYEVDKNPKDIDADGIQYPNDLDKHFTVKKNGDLIIVGESGYLYTGGAHGMPSEEYYHFNYKTGDFYELADLFKKGSNYAEKLTSIIQQQINLKGKIKVESSDYYFEPKKVKVSEKQPFEITDEYLRIYYTPYEIAPYAAGFPEFCIPYGQIVSIIDTEGSPWKSFDKAIKDIVTMRMGTVNDEAAKQISELINSYETSMIDAINSNDFSKVEANLVLNSSLYNDQKKLIDSLNKQAIKEKFNSVEIYAIAYEYSKKDYKVFVNEDIAIKYGEAEFTNKKFSWCYTVQEDGGKYKLSGIESW